MFGELDSLSLDIFAVPYSKSQFMSKDKQKDKQNLPEEGCCKLKKITLSLDDQINDGSAREISSSLNNLSGVVVADVSAGENRAYAYTGDQLDAYTASNAVRETGHNAHVLKNEYITDVKDYKKDMFPHAAPVASILSD